MSFPSRPLAAALLVGAFAAWHPVPALADATLFLGTGTSPDSRPVVGGAVGAGLLVVGFEFEYAATREDLEVAAPSLHTFMGNVLVQTPVPVGGVQFYGTVGGGLYRERLGEAARETHLGTNLGGGVKIGLAGPLRIRLDYRVFVLRGNPLYDTPSRFYAGLNLKF
jgi:hypothetical protein